MVLVKSLKFCDLYICGKIGQEYAFHDILERKNAFLDYKKEKFKKDKKLGFLLKGIVHGFCQIILGKTGENNTFHDILEGKNVYLQNKNTRLKKSEHKNFSQGDSPLVLLKNLKFFHLFI